MSSEPTTDADFDVEAYQKEHEQPDGAESAFLSVVMFAGLVIFAVGCWALGGWG